MITQNGVGITALLNGETIKQTLNPANETVDEGIYVATTLSTVDADLAVGNIRNGITIYGFAGDADVHDISDATAVEAEVLAPETFYAVGGGRRTGTMPTVALAPGSSAYPAGYHAGDGGGLPAIDADLVPANIKNGITIFNIPGDVDVRDVSDADALVGEVKTGSTFYAVGGARKTGNGTQTLNPANENVPAGYYALTTLSAVDAQLAAANILSGVNIFGFVGPATVQDIADANAILSDVKAGRTFYSVTGVRKTGNLATVALAADNNAYPAGYHVGAANLAAVDASLATANIRSGVNIFGYVGVATVQEIGAANAILSDVKNGKTFFSVTGGIKTGNLATVALAAGVNAYPQGYHVGAADLTAVDGDLAAGNIADGVTIFGVLGTLTAGPTVVRKTADQQLQNSAVLQNDDHLFFAIGANEEWCVDFILFNYGSENEQMKFAITVPVDAEIEFGSLCYMSTGQALTDPIRTSTPGAAVNTGITGAAGHLCVRFQGWIKNAGNSGNVQLQWAQVASNPGWVRLYEGSYLVAYQVA